MTPWTAARQAPLSMGFSSQEYWSGLPFLSPGDLPNSGIESGSPTFWADSLPTELQGEIFWRRHPIIPGPFVEETIFALLYGLCSFIKDQLTVFVGVYFWDLYSFPLICLFVLLPIPYSLGLLYLYN